MSKSTCTVLKKMSKNLFHDSWTALSHSSNILKIRGLSVLRRIFAVSLLLVSWLLVYLPLVLFCLSSKRSECYSFFQLKVKGQRAFPRTLAVLPVWGSLWPMGFCRAEPREY